MIRPGGSPTSFHLFWVALSFFLISGSCRTEDPGSEGDEAETVTVTVWTDSYELFLEYPQLRVGEAVHFAAHLTNLNTFHPVSTGPVAFRFVENQELLQEVIVEEPLRPGIFVPELTFERPSSLTLLVIVGSGSSSGEIQVPPLRVYGPDDDPPSVEDAEVRGDPITYLKEQQWKLPFRTEIVTRHTLKESVLLSGKVLARPGGDFRVVPPLAGRFIPTAEGPPLLGQWLEKGEMLGWIEPALPAPEEVAMETARVQTGVSLVQLEERIVDARARVITGESELQLAQQEKGRSERLLRVEAVPARRLEIAESKLRIAEANLTAATDNLQTLLRARTELASPRVGADVQHRRLPLHSPGSGRLVQSTAAPGAFVSRDQTLFRIVDLSRVWIRGEIHQSDLNDVAGAASALVQLPDGSQIEVGKGSDRLLLMGDVLDPETRTFPIVWEVANPDRRFKVGLLLGIQVFNAQTVQGLAVPDAAVFREENKAIVYVHAAGETFDRRIVETGPKDGGLIQILKGLSEGERVVVEGGYEVALAARASSGSGEGHVH